MTAEQRLKHRGSQSVKIAKPVISRECALTRETMPVEDLFRFAVGPDNILMPDVDAKAPGRGVWTTLSADVVEQAVAKKAFARSLKQQVTVPKDLAQLAHARLEQRLLGALGLARKAGQLVSGAAKVTGAIANPGIIALFTATDAAPDGRNKMLATSKARAHGEPVVHFELLTSLQMGLALGQENVIHAALTNGAAARSALSRAQRLARYTNELKREDTAI